MWVSWNRVVIFLSFSSLWKSLCKIGVISYLIFDIIHQHSHLELGLEFFIMETFLLQIQIFYNFKTSFSVFFWCQVLKNLAVCTIFLSSILKVMSPFHSWHWLLIPFLWSALQGIMNFIKLSKNPAFQLPYLFLCRFFFKLKSINLAVSSFYFLKLNFLSWDGSLVHWFSVFFSS